MVTGEAVSTIEWLSLIAFAAFVIVVTEWFDARVKIEREKTRQAEIAAKAGKVKP